MRTSGLTSLTSGREPQRSRKRSTTESLTLCSAKWVLRVASGPRLIVDVTSMARVSAGPRWSSHVIACTAAYSSSIVVRGNEASRITTRLATLDQRQAL